MQVDSKLKSFKLESTETQKLEINKFKTMISYLHDSNISQVVTKLETLETIFAKEKVDYTDYHESIKSYVEEIQKLSRDNQLTVKAFFIDGIELGYHRTATPKAGC